MSNYAYGRVSAKDQKLELQLDAFMRCGITFNKIYCDKKSGKDFERDQYKKMIKKIKTGDLLVIKSIDRLGRNYDAIIIEWKHITQDVGADILVLDMPFLDTRTYKNLIGRLIADIVLQLLSFVAENERENIRSRQAEGIAIAKQKGVRFGRPRVTIPSNFSEVAAAYLSRKISYAEALRLTNLRPTTFYRYIKGYYD
jgi:DNA invertase Pin-like site-specific DNA recombinase